MQLLILWQFLQSKTIMLKSKIWPNKKMTAFLFYFRIFKMSSFINFNIIFDRIWLPSVRHQWQLPPPPCSPLATSFIVWIFQGGWGFFGVEVSSWGLQLFFLGGLHCFEKGLVVFQRDWDYSQWVSCKSDGDFSGGLNFFWGGSVFFKKNHKNTQKAVFFSKYILHNALKCSLRKTQGRILWILDFLDDIFFIYK